MTPAAAARTDTPARTQRSSAQRDLEKATADLEKLNRRAQELRAQQLAAESALAGARRELAVAAAAGSGDTKALRDRIRQLTGDLEEATGGLQLLDSRRIAFERQQRTSQLALAEEQRSRARDAHHDAQQAVEDAVRTFVEGPLARALENLTAAGDNERACWVALQNALRAAGRSQEDASRHPRVYQPGQSNQSSPLGSDLHESIDALLAYCGGRTRRQRDAQFAERRRQDLIAAQKREADARAKERSDAEALVEARSDERVEAARRSGGPKAALDEALAIVQTRNATGRQAR